MNEIQKRVLLNALERLPGLSYGTVGHLSRETGIPAEEVVGILETLFTLGGIQKATWDGVSYRYRLVRPRCESRLREGKRSWRCTLEQQHYGRHLNPAGGRAWR